MIKLINQSIDHSSDAVPHLKTFVGPISVLHLFIASVLARRLMRIGPLEKPNPKKNLMVFNQAEINQIYTAKGTKINTWTSVRRHAGKKNGLKKFSY
jgi:hypothetical protein